MIYKRLQQGGYIDRSIEHTFSWNNKKMSGFEGDTLASALLANQVSVIGRSFKYHRPRGVCSAGAEESGAIITVTQSNQSTPNTKATQHFLEPSLALSGQNSWPSVDYDIGAINQLFSPFLAAGFYYKTFMGPTIGQIGRNTKAWMFFEKFIRKAAGMGSVPKNDDADFYEHAYAHCDALIIGAGVAGITAALGLAEAGQDVLLIEQDRLIGGDLLNTNRNQHQQSREYWCDLLSQSSVKVMMNTTAVGLYDHGSSVLIEKVSSNVPNVPKIRMRCWSVTSKRIILATGAMERTFAFPNNDRPGIMNAYASGVYLNRYALLPQGNVVFATNNDSVYKTACDMMAKGQTPTVLDVREQTTSPFYLDFIKGGGKVIFKAAPANAFGGKRISKISLAKYTNDEFQTTAKQIPADHLFISGGWSPILHLLAHRGSKLVWDANNACFVQKENHEYIYVTGSAQGIWDEQDCIDHAKQVVHSINNRKPSPKSNLSKTRWHTPTMPIYEIKNRKVTTKSFVDLQHDVTTADIKLAIQEGFISPEHVKRYTTLGMATDGGKMGGVIGLGVIAETMKTDISKVGVTTFRPPYVPVELGALAGRFQGKHFRPLRRTPLHQWNLDHSAVMQSAGLWERPWYFSCNGTNLEQASFFETTTTRTHVGLCDVSSLGKIAIQGPDAATLIDRLYTNRFDTLAVGKAKYGIMLREDGLVYDDGTTWCLAENDYFMTTTTANAPTVMAFIEEMIQTRWHDLKVRATSVSEQWAGCAIAGPKSRLTLAACLKQPSLIDNSSLPFMGVLTTFLHGDIPCRIARISFSGELAYEVYVPSNYAVAMMSLLWKQAKKNNGCLYGLEALGIMRIEKGHITGSEIDGRVTIDDLGFGKMASTKKSYIGSVLRTRSRLNNNERPKLVGIIPMKKHQKVMAGSILCSESMSKESVKGWVTATTYSPTFKHFIGLGFISGGHSHWEGKTVIASDPVNNTNALVEVVSPHMYDPTGEKMHG